MVALTAARSRGRVDSSTTGIMVHVPFRVDIAIFHYGLLRSGHGHKIGTRLTALLRLTSCRILFRHILMMIVILFLMWLITLWLLMISFLLLLGNVP